MTTYRVENTSTGLILGDYIAETVEEALDKCARDAGYKDQADIAEQLGQHQPLVAYEVE